ncbi:MAG: carboxypeptidase-like regulatory domain-containing protein, partial [Desulfobacteraceae bacterium]|nr:carboxypeptidase-like regulatory domain-containing protein [Desulfobacteraceae bacterium]
MNASTSTIARHLLFSRMGRLMIRVLVFLLVFQGIAFDRIATRYQWEPDGARRWIKCVAEWIGEKTALALDVDPCSADLDGDGTVGGSDLPLFLELFGHTDGSTMSESSGDFEEDGDVDGTDLAVMATSFNTTGCNGSVPLPSGSFGGTYQHLIPDDATVSAYDLERFAVITGRVQNEAGAGLSGVSVSVLDHPEYGTALSDADGRFYLPVQGGGKLTLRYRLSGYIEAQRDINAPWSDFVVAQTPVLIPYDTTHTTISFDGNPATTLVHVGSTVSDADGSREAVVVFSGDTTAMAIMTDGSTSPLTGPLTVRATEFPTPASMPAILPPTSGFTYCV